MASSTTTPAKGRVGGRTRPAACNPDDRRSRQEAGQGPRRVSRDLAALGELSRLCQSDDGSARSLGLPVSGPPIGVFSLFRLPLGAFRPNDLMYVYEGGGRISGLIRSSAIEP